MGIQQDHLARLRDFGYTEVEARFLYLVAAHSGYFTVRQFLGFAEAKSGKRNAQLVEKLFSLGHASAQRYTRRSLVYHLSSRQLYSAIGKDYLRNRREHELSHIKTRLLALDFILAHPKEDYFETAEARRQYFVERFKVSENLFNPLDGRSNPITFTDRFPLCIAYPSPDFMPVVTFTYVDPGHRNLAAYISHLRTYRPLFRQLPGFQFLYISTAAGLQKEAAELFSLIVEGKGLSELIRYFDLESKWNREQYGLLTEQDVIFLSDARKHYTGESISTLYYLWRRKQLPKDFQAEAAPVPRPAQKILFRAFTVPGHEAIFGDSTKNWGDGWQIRGCSRAASPRGSLSKPTQTLQRTVNA
ncbi:MAG TPA: hypothetical protein VJO16_06325 [Candidatus Acidoferrum sp.]|nr:hypothetical protein [Candidatus Acidoferrum sp.]